MQRRQFIRNTALLGGASFLFGQKALASFFAPNYQIRMLRRNVGIFTERGGTIGFLKSKEGSIIIDAQFPDTSKHLIEELQKESIAFKYLLNTHHHGDHSSGNIAYKGLVEHVAAHANSVANQRKAAEKNGSLEKQLLPDLSFEKEWKLKLGDEKVKGHYFGAAHTNGDAVYHFEEANVMHVGDLMFYKRHPFVDRSSGASMRNWIKVLNDIYKTADKNTIIIFGHSLNPGEETGSREDLRKFQDYLQKVLQFTEAEIKRGVTKEEFIKNTSVPGVTEWSGQGLERPLMAAYEELSSKGA